METIARIFRVLAWIALAVTTAFQVLVIMGIRQGDSAFNTMPIVVATVLMVVAVVLFCVLPRGKIVPLLMAVAAAVLFVVIAVNIKAVFTVRLSTDGSDLGITSWRLVYRHLSPVLVPILLFPVWLNYHLDRQLQKAYAEKEQPTSYLGLEDFQLSRLDDEENQLPAKGSVRARRRKNNSK